MSFDFSLFSIRLPLETKRWGISRSIAERYGERFVLLQTDLEKAFNSIDHHRLMAVLEESKCCGEDELRIIQFLLAETKLRARVEGELGPSFPTLSGTPQGNALSRVLFIICFAYILDRADTALSTTSTGPHDIPLTYVDDHHVIFREYAVEITQRERLDTKITELVDSGQLEDTTHPPECNCVNCCSHHYPLLLPSHLQYEDGPSQDKIYREITSTDANLGQVLGYQFECEALVKSRKPSPR